MRKVLMGDEELSSVETFRLLYGIPSQGKATRQLVVLGYMISTLLRVRGYESFDEMMLTLESMGAHSTMRKRRRFGKLKLVK
jgi:hypothetical protein